MNILTEIKDGVKVFSWRKTLAGIVGLIFTTHCIGFLHRHNFDELPTSYMITIGSVFAFYFGKDVMRNTKITIKN